MRRGLSVVVVERDEHPRGASVRNFGHCYVSAQAGRALELALESRTRWLELAREAGFWILESGTVLALRGPEELAVALEFADARPELARVLRAEQALARAPLATAGLLGGLWTPLDLRVDPRRALPALIEWLQARGVEFHWRTTALGAETGVLLTSRGELRGEAIVIAVGHDLDRVLPDQAEDVGMRRCSLQMARVASPNGQTIGPALATGLALLRYRGFEDCPSRPVLRAQLERARPELLHADVNLIVTQLPDGDLVIGDTHRYAVAPSPFRDEKLDRLLLEEAAALLASGPLEVRERWQGVYAHAPGRELLIGSPAPGVRAVTVTTGIGMTIGLGLAKAVLSELVDQRYATL